MGIEQTFLGEYLIIYAFYVYGMVCYAMAHNKAKLPGFPVQTPSNDRALMAYWIHTHGIIKKNGLRFLGIKQITIDNYHDIEMDKYHQDNPSKEEINARSSDALFEAIRARNVRNK